MTRPLYCPDLEEDKPCPACGATVEGNDPVHGVCQAIRSGPDPRTNQTVRLVLIDRETGEEI